MKIPQLFIVFVDEAMYSKTKLPLSVCRWYFRGILTVNTRLNTVLTSLGSISIPLLITNARSVPNSWFGPEDTWPDGTHRIAQCIVLTTVMVSALNWNSQNIHLTWLPIVTSVLVFLSAISTARVSWIVCFVLESWARWLYVTSCLFEFITGLSLAK